MRLQKSVALLRGGLTAAIFAFSLTQAQANTFNLTLSGMVGNGSFSSFDSGATHYDQWAVALAGLDSSNAITVGVGDTINATITLDQSFTIPASVDLTWGDLTLWGSSFPSGDTKTEHGTITFSDDGVVGGPSTTSGNCSSNASLPICYTWHSPGSITFDTVTMSFDITKLASSTVFGTTATLDSAALGYTLFSPAAPVPEPETYAMMLAGLGLLGLAARRKNQKAG